MTAGAFLAQPSFMRFVRTVTVNALRWGLAKILAGNMASLARDSPVCSFQCKIGRPVIEGIGIELEDIGIPAFVFSVTLLAFAFDCGVRSAMET